MKLKTLRELNQLTQHFYQVVGEEFDQTRQQSWPGWERLWLEISPLLLKNATTEFRVLDLGCGNGRFLKFLTQHISESTRLTYLGVDSNQRLLEKIKPLNAQGSVKTYCQDLVAALIQNTWPNSLMKDGSFDLIVGFGLIHHLAPELASRLLAACQKMCHQNGLICLTTWKAQDKKPQLIPHNLISEFGGNDFLFGWGNPNQALRYCHLYSAAEFGALIHQSRLNLLKSWEADGATMQDNRYFLLSAIPQTATPLL